ncbi:MAG: helix-turn-helix domain-containing protein [Actinobacteria bacterium]|uniref:Unannotated protein n=1 Tax=freshwater metagenome TaxID=449393 RepID=A0A6J7EVS3_9ZZZZ|nr:helix-turn-helix domain-containing protein [Actinomycetota bacterium]
MSDTEAVVSHEYDFESWCRVLAENDIPMQIACAQRSTFRASLKSRNLGGIHFFDIRSDAHVAKRTSLNLMSDDMRVYGITLQIEGSSTISQDGQTSVLNPGDFALYDSTREFAREFFDNHRCLIVRFPHTMMQLPSHTLRHVTATRFGASEGVGVVVSPFLLETANNLADLSGWSGVRVAHALIDLVSSAFAEKLTDEQVATANPRANAFVRICDYVADNLGDPHLSPDYIAQANFISTRQLHKIFHAERITVSQFIRERRLEQCRRQLADPADAHLTVGQIAAQWAIYDGAHFSRIFRNAYGMSPRDYRRSQLDTSVA